MQKQNIKNVYTQSLCQRPKSGALNQGETGNFLPSHRTELHQKVKRLTLKGFVTWYLMPSQMCRLQEDPKFKTGKTFVFLKMIFLSFHLQFEMREEKTQPHTQE